jgi:chromosome segregation ATPase
MDFYGPYQRLLSEIENSKNVKQRGYMEEMDKAFIFYKTQSDKGNNIIETVEKQKATLESDVQKLKDQRERILEEFRSLRKTEIDLRAKIKKLNIKKKALGKDISDLDFLYKSKAIGKGIYVKRNVEVTELLLELHEYATNNKCELKESLGKQVRKKAAAALRVCRGSRSPENNRESKSE